MLAQLTVTKTLPTTTHLLVLLPKSKTLPKDAAHGALLAAVLKRRAMKVNELAQCAVDTGKQTGERLCAFPLDEDYEAELDSKMADIKQCTLAGDADHIVASEVNGFGVAWGVAMLKGGH